MPVQAILQRDFSGGLNLVTNPYLVQPKQITSVRNMLLDEHGSLSTRDGSFTMTTSPDTTNPIVYRGVLNKVNGTVLPYAIQNTGTINTLRRTDSTPWPTVGSTNTAYLTPQSVTVIDTELIAVGQTETPRTWDGTTWSQITALGGQVLPPGANHVAFHLGSVWLWNTAAATTATDGPSSLRMSDATNPLGSWPTANQTFIAKDDGTQGMGLSSYTIAETGISPTATLVAFKNYSGYQISGVFGASNFSVQRIKSDMGCIAPRSIQFVSGFGIIRLTHKGFALYNGVDDKLISEEIRPAIFGDPSGALSHAGGIAGINFTSASRAWAAQSQNPPLYICAAPISGTTLTRLFVYDLIRKAWTLCDYPTPIQTITLFTTQALQPQVQVGTSTGGKIQRYFSGDTTDDGAAIVWSFRTRPITPNPPTELAYFRRATLDLLYTPTQNVTVLISPAGQAAISRTAVFTAPSTGALWGAGTSVWGSFKWGAAGTVESRVSVDIQRTAPSVFLDVSGSGIVRCRAISWQAVTKPLTRARG